MKASHTLLQAEQHLPEVYALLADVALLGASDGPYAQALHKVLAASQASEQQAPLHLTILPLLCCQLAGGTPRKAVPAAAAWRALQIAAKLLDDVEDGEIDCTIPGAAAHTNRAQVINISTGFIAASNLVMTRLAPSACHALQPLFQSTILQMAGGQHIELACEAGLDLSRYHQIMAAKSGAFFALASVAGAMCATANPSADDELISLFKEFGYNIGMLVQLLDDLGDWRRNDGQGDLAMGHRTLPVFYALEVALPTEAAQLEKLLSHARTNREAESEAAELMTALGANVYALAEIGRHEDNALKILDAISGAISILPSRGKANAEPLRKWLATLFSLAAQFYAAQPCGSDELRESSPRLSGLSDRYLPGRE